MLLVGQSVTVRTCCKNKSQYRRNRVHWRAHYSAMPYDKRLHVEGTAIQVLDVRGLTELRVGLILCILVSAVQHAVS